MSSHMSFCSAVSFNTSKTEERERSNYKVDNTVLLIDTFKWGKEGRRASFVKRFPSFTRSSFW
jgi:hypothetical protein